MAQATGLVHPPPLLTAAASVDSLDRMRSFQAVLECYLPACACSRSCRQAARTRSRAAALGLRPPCCQLRLERSPRSAQQFPSDQRPPAGSAPSSPQQLGGSGLDEQLQRGPQGLTEAKRANAALASLQAFSSRTLLRSDDCAANATAILPPAAPDTDGVQAQLSTAISGMERCRRAALGFWLGVAY